jgi:hemerythrin
MIKWSLKYATGISVIDEQHQKFFTTFNRLFDALIEGKAKDELAAVLLELTDYAEQHFATEEKYFHDFQYEGAQEHIMQHDDFRQKLKNFKKNFFENVDREKLASEMIADLDNWFSRHLVEMDHKYIECFQKHGLK